MLTGILQKMANGSNSNKRTTTQTSGYRFKLLFGTRIPQNKPQQTELSKHFNKTDVRHYNPIFFIVVTDWKAAPLEASELDNALADYNESKNQDLDMPF